MTGTPIAGAVLIVVLWIIGGVFAGEPGEPVPADLPPAVYTHPEPTP